LNVENALLGDVQDVENGILLLRKNVSVKKKMSKLVHMSKYPGYEEVEEVLDQALKQTAEGKGKERHGRNSLPFIEQPIMEIQRRCGPGFTLGQASKKIDEAYGMFLKQAYMQAIRELLGAIIYIAAAVVFINEQTDNINVDPELKERTTNMFSFKRITQTIQELLS